MTLIAWNDQAATHQRPQPQDAVTTMAIKGHQSHPLPFPVHMVERPRHCTQAHDADCPIPNARAPSPTDNLNGTQPQQQLEGTTSTLHQAQRPWHCAQACSANSQCPTVRAATTNVHHSAQPPPQSRGANATPLNHPPPGCNAQASHTSTRCQSHETMNRRQ